jgi:hypothetical protein
MNDKQRENTAKYLYDLSKVVFTFSVVANGVSKDFSTTIFWFGLFSAAFLFAFACLLDGGSHG